MPARGEISLKYVMSEIRPSFYGALLLVLCILVCMVEGIDAEVMALAAPAVAKGWGLTAPAIGFLLASAVAGQVLGSIVLGPLGDRFGRRPAIMLALAMAAFATLAGAFAPTYHILLSTRVVAGVALGLALPNTSTVAMELVPPAWRTFAVVLVFCGLPLGVTAGAVTVGHMVGTYGYRAAFFVGTAATVIVLAACAALLPESPVILARRSGPQTALRLLLARLGVSLANQVVTARYDTRVGRPGMTELFVPERRSITFVLWLLNFVTLLLIYYFLMWLPSLVMSLSGSVLVAANATAVFSGSSVIGGLVLAALMTRRGPVVALICCYTLMIAALTILASANHVGPLFYLGLAGCGATLAGSQFCLGAVVSQYYPAPIRATGVAYAFGVGHIGAVLAPMIGGLVVNAMPNASSAFGLAVGPALLSLGLMLLLRKWVGLNWNSAIARQSSDMSTS